MAYVIVEVPDGEYCRGCRFLVSGTILCSLFDDFVTEVDDYTKKRKCDRCPREDKE